MVVIEKWLLIRDWAAIYCVPAEVEIEGANSLAPAKFGEQIAPRTMVGFSEIETQGICDLPTDAQKDIAALRFMARADVQRSVGLATHFRVENTYIPDAAGGNRLGPPTRSK